MSLPLQVALSGPSQCIHTGTGWHELQVQVASDALPVPVAEAQAEVQAEAASGSGILEEEGALAGGGEPEGLGNVSAGVIASVLQFSGALAVAE